MQVLLAWGLAAGALCGIGFAAGAAWRGPPGRIGLSLAFWTGVAVTCALLAAWHLFLPVDGRVWILLGPLGAAGAVLEARARRGVPLRMPLQALPVLLFAAWIASRAVQPAFCPDDGLYYTQTVRWTALYPAVPGLGNLHPLLAMNNAYHLLVAALGVGPLRLRGDHVANGLLLVATAATCATGLFALLDPRKAPDAADVLAAVLLGPALDFSISGTLACPAADFAVYMCGTALLLEVARPSLRGLALDRRRACTLVLACAGAVILKQSLVCVALPVAAAAMGSAAPARRLPMLACGAAIAAAVALPWVIHGAVLSGYPAFPSPWPDLGFSWRMDPKVLVGIQHWIHAYARAPGRTDEQVRAAGWAADWLAREWLNDRTFLFPAALAAAGALGTCAAVLGGRRPPGACLVALVPVGAGLALWWILAPDTRFAGPLLWAAATLLSLAAALAFHPRLDGGLRVAFAALAVALALGAFAGWQPSFPWTTRFPPLRHGAGVSQAKLRGGEVIGVAGKGGCFDLPCGWPPVDPRLRLRKPGDWAAGFTLQPPEPAPPAPAPR